MDLQFIKSLGNFDHRPTRGSFKGSVQGKAGLKPKNKILVFLRVCDAQFTSFTTENAFVGVHDQKFLLYGKENFRGLLKMHSKTKILTSLKSVKLRIKSGC